MNQTTFSDQRITRRVRAGAAIAPSPRGDANSDFEFTCYGPIAKGPGATQMPRRRQAAYRPPVRAPFIYAAYLVLVIGLVALFS